MYEFAKYNKVFYLFIEPSHTTVCVETVHTEVSVLGEVASRVGGGSAGDDINTLRQFPMCHGLVVCLHSNSHV